MTHSSDELGRDGVSEWALLAEAADCLANHPPYAADTTFAEIWRWLQRNEELRVRIDAMLRARSEGGSDVKG